MPRSTSNSRFLTRSLLAAAVAAFCASSLPAAADHHGDKPSDIAAGHKGSDADSKMSASEGEMKKDKSANMSKASDMTVLEVAEDAGSFSTLLAAIEAADLTDTLNGDGPFTVLAPTDEAFDALPDGTLDVLLAPENKQMLTDILTYHVVPAKAMAKDVVTMDEADTVNGAKLPITVDGETVMLGESPTKATVTKTDIKAKNGVIHVIDTVLLPPKDGM